MKSPWKEVSVNYPCSKCLRTTWCSYTINGNLLICRRANDGTGRRRTDKNGDDFWLYNYGKEHNFRIHRNIPSICENESLRETPEKLDQVYCALLSLLPLDPTHAKNLLERGLSEKEIVKRQYRTLPKKGRAELANRLLDQFGVDVCSKIPGLYLKDKSYWNLAGNPGLIIPIRDRNAIIALKIRHDKVPQGESRYTSFSSKFHGGPSPGSPIHIPLFDSFSNGVFRLTEGELKADIATALSATHTISIPGVTTWRRAIPVLKRLEAKTVILSFDSDAHSNPVVARALVLCARNLMNETFNVEIETWE